MINGIVASVLGTSRRDELAPPLHPALTADEVLTTYLGTGCVAPTEPLARVPQTGELTRAVAQGPWRGGE